MHFCAGRCFYHGCSFSAGFLGAYNISDRRVVDPHPSFSNMLRLFHGFITQGNFLWHYTCWCDCLFCDLAPVELDWPKWKPPGSYWVPISLDRAIVLLLFHVTFTSLELEFFDMSQNFMTVWVAQLTKHITKKNLNDLPRRLTLFALVCLFF